MHTLLERKLSAFGAQTEVPFAIIYPGGARYANRAEAPRFTVRFKTRGAERRVVAFGHIGFLDAYFDGDIDVDGNLGDMFRIGLAAGFDSPNLMVVARNRWHEWRRNNATIERAKNNARFHYGLGTEFYRIWLDDPYMMYTCAYWEGADGKGRGAQTLEDAQQAKIEHVCRKIRLRRGESVVDVGCGFGGFMRYASEHYGASVVGINTTTEQVRAVAEDIVRRGMQARESVIEADFREIPGMYDKVVSIGVLEHAGRDQVDAVVRAHAGALRPGGLGMLHFIGHIGRRETELFIRENVFPGGWIPALAEVIEAMERHGLEVVDIENLRRHYALTLDEWARRFDAGWPRIHAIDPTRFDERFRRIWQTYLVGCAEMFRSPNAVTHLFQITFSKGNTNRSNYPMDRSFLYEASAVQRAHRLRTGLAA